METKKLPPLRKKVPLKVETTVKEVLPVTPSKKSILSPIKSEISSPEIELSKLSREALFSIAIHLDLPQILKLCATNKEIDRKLCQRDPIWNRKIEQVSDQESVQKIKEETNLKGKELYELIYSLIKVKEAFKLKDNIYELYMRDILDL